MRKYRNKIFHNEDMEMEDTKADRYIDVMIAVLQDSKELVNRPEAQAAVQKLLEVVQTLFHG